MRSYLLKCISCNTCTSLFRILYLFSFYDVFVKKLVFKINFFKSSNTSNKLTYILIYSKIYYLTKEKQNYKNSKLKIALLTLVYLI